MFVPRVPNPFDDDAQRTERLGRQLDASRRWRLVFCVGWLVLGVWGLLALLGYPGAGLVLVPVGAGMIIGGGIQLVLDRL